MKLFQCDQCPLKLKCNLIDKQLKIMKRWRSDEVFKELWDRVETVTLENHKGDVNEFYMDLGYILGQFRGMAVKDNTLTKWNRIWNDVWPCIRQYAKSQEDK